MVHLNIQQYDTRSESIQHEDSSSSLDVCDMTPLSPHTGENGFAFSRPSEGKVYFVDEAAKRRKMAADGPPKKRPKEGSCQWKVSIIAAFTILTVLLLIAISFAMRSFQCKEEADEEQGILDMYKGFFKTKSEMDDMMKTMNEQDGSGKHAAIRNRPNSPHFNCSLVEPKVLPLRNPQMNHLPHPEVPDELTYHGCCETNHTYRMFNRLPKMDGQLLKIVQFKSRKQYFFVDNCIHMMPCTVPCQCMQRARHVMAVVANDDLTNVRLEWVQYQGTCKCINTEVTQN
ncbi:hypothetical protein PoB_004176700 [Plakobranchus ocellatus]|uniref:Spaetzle domain-containing protein n=1 Tax=Plakobranchus ocellatus TaxID=259542 RepID=A0AAV4B6W9_9GAST|nr:hypothetical protein PoB_004176700 [Plakobranchus ocellatus]